MNIKIKIFLASLFLFFGFLSGTNLAKAVCCAPISGSCYNVAVTGMCSGVDLELPGGGDCLNENTCIKCCTGLTGTNRCGDPAGAGCGALGGTPSLETCGGLSTTLCTGVPGNDPSFTGITFPNPLKIDTVVALLTSILKNLKGIIVVIAIIFIVIGGIMYMTSGGNEKMLTMGRKAVSGAVIGLAIALAAPAFLQTILNILEIDPNSGVGTASPITLKEIAVNVMQFLLSVFGTIAIISIVIAGIMYLTAGGDDKRMETGKKMFKYGLIGIIVALSALVLVKEVSKLIGATI